MTLPCAGAAASRSGVHRGGHRELAGGTTHYAGRPAALLGPGDHDGADVACRLELPVPDHSTIGRRARTIKLPARPRSSGEPLHLLVDSTGLKLGGPAKWLV